MSSTTGFHGKEDGSSISKPYLICTYAQLRKIKDGLGLNKHYALGRDIIAPSSPDWEAMGSDARQFTGSLDGRGYDIQKLKATGSKSGAQLALFGTTSKNAVIRNIGLRDINIEVSSRSSKFRVAGLVIANHGSIVNSYVTGGNISVTAATNDLSAVFHSAGLVVENEPDGKIGNSYAMVSVTTTVSPPGGINSAAIYGGGLAYRNKGKIESCYARGSVASTSQGPALSSSGALVDENNAEGASVGYVRNSYATGSVSSTGGTSSYSHGFITVLKGSGVLSNNYWDSGSTAATLTKGSDTVATGLSKTQMQADSGPALGDQFIFTSGSYPKLKYGESSGSSDVDCGGSTNLTCGQPYGGNSCGSKWRACVEANDASRPFAAHEKARKNFKFCSVGNYKLALLTRIYSVHSYNILIDQSDAYFFQGIFKPTHTT